MKRILITRPHNSAVILAEKIKAQLNNIESVIFPAIEIMAVTENPFSQISWPTIDNIIFISPAAVENTAKFMPILPSHIKLFAIGQDSAEKIHALGLNSGVEKIIFPKEKYNSESLLNLEELQNINNQTILICKGAGGNNLLLETLSARRAKVIEVITYQRCLPQPKIFPDLDKIDLIISTSGESLKNLILLFGDIVKEKQLLVSSEKLKTFATDILGFKYPPLLAENAGDEALINVMMTLYEIYQENLSMKLTRWQQRYENFESAFILLRDALKERSRDDFSPLEKEGLIQRFEYTFELAWKTLKDYLEYSGIVLDQITPRAVIKQAFVSKLLKDGQAWIDMLDYRNLMSHTYNQKIFEKAIDIIAEKYINLLNNLYLFLKEKDI